MVGEAPPRNTPTPSGEEPIRRRGGAELHSYVPALLYAILCCALAPPMAASASSDSGRPAGDGCEAGTGWGNTPAELAVEAVKKGWVLPLDDILRTVSKTVSGEVLEVDLCRTQRGDWRYAFLVLTKERRYYEVVVDARRNQVIQARQR